MRKHFLLLFLMALLPLAGWAQIDLSGVTPTLSQNSYIYTGATPEVVIHVVSPTTQQEINDVEWIKVFYDANGNEIASSSVATDVLNVGTYYVAAQVPEGNPTFRGTTKKVEFNITARPLTISFAQVNKTYGYHRDANYKGDAKFITYTVTDANVTPAKVYNPFSDVQADATAGKTFVQNIGLTVQREAQDENYNVAYSNNNVAGYAFSWKVTDKNYVVTRATTGDQDPQTEATNFKISPKALEIGDIAHINYTAGTHVYNGNKQVGTFVNAEGEDYDYDYDVTWFDNADLNGEAVASPKEVGTYYAKLTGKGNYSGTLGYTANPNPDNNSKNWKFTITRRPVTIEIVDGTKVYDGKNIDPSTVTINYGNIAPADAQSIINNFGNSISVAFGDNEADHKAVKYTDGQNPTVTHYGLVLKVTDDFADTKLFKNYGFEQPNDEVIAISVDGNKVIEGISGKYTITRRPVEFKANLVTTTFGTEPNVPEVSIGDASKEADVTAKSVLYVAPAEGTENAGIVVYDTDPVTSDLDDFAVADFKLSKTEKAEKDSKQYAWNAAPADLYTGAIVLDEGENPSAMSKNYDITFTNGDVRVGGLTVRVTVNTTSIKYGDKVSNNLFSYSTNPSNKTLVGTPNYHIYEITVDEHEEYVKGAEVTDEEILPKGTYWVELDKTGMKAPDNYELGEFNPGYLIVEKKPITVEVPELTLNVNDTEETLNAYISPKTYDTGINNETISFVYSFNTEGANAVQTINNNGVITVNSSQGTYANGIKGALVTNTAAPNYLAANENYEVTFTFGGLKLDRYGDLVLNQQDPNLNAKIHAAATAGSNYTIKFGSRELKADQWYTVVLPFPLTTVALVNALQKKISDTESEPVFAIVNRLSTASTAGNVSFKLEMKGIPANEPFLIKVAEDIDLKDTKEILTAISYTESAEVGGEKFAGNIFKGVYTDTDIKLVSGEHMVGFLGVAGETFNTTTLKNKWYSSETAKTIKPLEAYLYYATVYTPGQKAPMVTVEDYENGATVIKNLNMETMKAYAVDGWYTLNGVKLQGMPTEKGIYINNGKKVVVK